MTKKLSISVAMCTYNGEKYLDEQLASVAQQTRLPDEMVVCDDCSSDATPEIIEEFVRTAPFPVRFIRNPTNLRSTKNFEKAIAMCNGDFIALCDQDDIWMPEKLARQAEMMERDASLGGVFSDAELIDAASMPLDKGLWDSIQFRSGEQKHFQAGRSVEILLKRNVVTGATLMLRTSLRPHFLPIPEVWVHDGWIAWMLVLASRVDFTTDRLIRYRLHASQLTGSVLLRDHRATLRQRLAIGKREEPAKHLAHARELEVLYQRLMRLEDPKSQAVLPDLRQAIRFFSDRETPYARTLLRLSLILRNTRNYQRYERGWKALIRDLVLVFISLQHESSVKP